MNDTASVEPDNDLAAICRAELQASLDETDGIIFAMAATVDGLEVAAVQAPGWSIPANRLAAMASSGHALGDTVAGEIAETQCRNVIIDAESHSIVLLSVPQVVDPPLILGVAATTSVSIGTVLVGARGCAKRIGEAATAAA